MYIFVSYKQSWINEEILTYQLSKIKAVLNTKWKNSYIFFLDTNFKNMTPKQIIQEGLNKIKKSEEVLCFIDKQEKSEGMLIELWIAKSLWKRISIYIKEEYLEYFWSIKWLTNNIIVYKDFNDFLTKLV